MKVTVIGGGAFAWTHELVTDIAVSPGFAGTQVCLMDIDAARLSLAEKLCRKIVSTMHAPIEISTTLDRAQALEGADCVLVAINTGGSFTHGNDVAVPLKYGIRASVGDTTGPAGISRALRNVPVVSEIAQDVHTLCPRAWLINVTNPMSTLTMAMCARHERTAGYCHEVEWLRVRMAHLFKVARKEVSVRTVGINHMSWVLALRIGDNPLGLDLLRRHLQDGGVLDDQGKPTPIVNELYELFGALPVSHDGHIAEFYAPYAIPEIAGRYRLRQYSGEIEEREVRQANKAKAEALLAGTQPLKLEHSYEQLSDIILALTGHGPFVGIANLPNRGQVENLPRGAVVETEAVYDWAGISPCACGQLRPLLASTLTNHCLCQELTVQAALTGDRRLVREALLTQPHIRDFSIVPRLAEDLLEANREYLPRFFGKQPQ